MRKIFTIKKILVLTLVMLVIIAPQTSFSQTTDDVADGITVGSVVRTLFSLTPAGQVYSAYQYFTTPAQGCSSLTNFSVGDCVMYGFAWVLRLILSLFAWILYLANEFFNAILYLSVIDFHKYFISSGDAEALRLAANETPALYFPLGDAINKGWTTIRDLFNISFIFILLYIAIGTILRSTHVDAKKMIPGIIIAALLINFSAVFPKIIIDAANVVSVTFYRGMDNGERNTPSLTNAPDLTKALLGTMPLGLGLLVNEDSGDVVIDTQLDEAAKSREGLQRIILESFIQIVVILVAAFVLLTVSFMMLVRIVTLIILIITSPIAFGGMILPSFLKKHSDEWWKKLISESIWLPVFMILFYITIQIAIEINKFGASTSTPISTTIVSGGVGEISFQFFRLFISYFVLIGFMIASLKIAKDTGGMGAKGAMALAGGVTAASAGAASWVAKKPITLGGKGAMMAASAADKKLLGGVGGRAMETTYKNVKPVGQWLAKTDLGKKVISTAKPVKENILHPLRYASDTVASHAGLDNVGFLGKAGKERAEDAKKQKELEKEEKEKKEKEKKDKIDKANKDLEAIVNSKEVKEVENYFDPTTGQVKVDPTIRPTGILSTTEKDKLKEAVDSVANILKEFTAKDFEEFDPKNFINPVAARALNFTEISRLEPKLTAGPTGTKTQLIKQVQQQNPDLYETIAASPMAANFGIRNEFLKAQNDLEKITRLNLDDRNKMMDMLDESLNNIVKSGRPKEIAKFFTIDHLEIMEQMDNAGLTKDDIKSAVRSMTKTAALDILNALNSATAGPLLAAKTGTEFGKFITDNTKVDQLTGEVK